MNILSLLDFQFSFGENYYNAEPSSQLLELLITLIGATAGAFLGYYLYTRQEKNDKDKRLKEEKKYFLHTLEGGIDYLKQQIEKNNKDIIDQKKEPASYIRFSTLYFNNFNYISKLNSSNLYEVFKKNKNSRSDDFFDIFLTTDHIQDTLNSLRISEIDTQRQYFNFIEEIEKSYNKIITTLENRLFCLENTIGVMLSWKEQNSISKLLKEFKREDVHDFKKTMTVSIPLIKDKENRQFINIHIYEQIINEGDTIERYVQKIISNNRKRCEKFTIIIIKLDESRDTLEKLIRSVI